MYEIFFIFKGQERIYAYFERSYSHLKEVIQKLKEL